MQFKINNRCGSKKIFSSGVFTRLEAAVNFCRLLADKFLNGFIRIVKVFAKHPLSLAGFSAALLFLVNIGVARADIITNFTTSAIGFIAQWVGYLIGVIAGIVFWMIGVLATVALNVNHNITDLSRNAIVNSGWNIILNITNLGFVLAIIVIAFATILKIDTYDIKKRLWKLVVAALLVNFSFVIGATLVNIGNNATQFMINKSIGGSGITAADDSAAKWSAAFGSMFQVQALLNVGGENVSKLEDGTVVQRAKSPEMKGVLEGALGSIITFVASLIFGAIFTFMAAMTFFTVVVLLFIRYVYLSFLLMLSPIIWLAWIFPATQEYWKEWWQRFIRWTFFAPIMMFFLYLALLTMSGMRSLGVIRSQSSFGNPLTFSLDIIGQMVIVIGIIMGGMFVANKMGIEFADKVYSTASKYGKGWAYRGAQRFMSGKFMMGNKDKEGWRKEGFTGLLAKRGRAGKLLGAGLAAQGLNYLGTKAEKGAADAMSSARSYFKGLSKDRQEIALASATPGRTRNVYMEEMGKAEKLAGSDFAANNLHDPDKLETILKGFKAQNLDAREIYRANEFNTPETLRLLKENGDKLKTYNIALKKAVKDNLPDTISLENTPIGKIMTEISEKQAKLMGRDGEGVAKSGKAVNELFKDHSKFEAVLGLDGVRALKQTFTDALIQSGNFNKRSKIMAKMDGAQVKEMAKLMVLSSRKDKDNMEKIITESNKSLANRLLAEEKDEFVKKGEEKKEEEGGEKKGGEKEGKK